MIPRFRHAALAAVLLLGAASLCAAPTTQLLSTGPGGSAALAYAASTEPAVSADGRFVAFLSNATSFGGSGDGRQLVYLRDLQTGQVELVSRSSGGTAADGHCRSVAISADGRLVLFASDADNLVPGDGNRSLDVFLRDRTAGTTERMDETAPGQELPDGCTASLALSGDGRFVAFSAYDGASSDVFIRDRSTGSIERLGVHGAGGDQFNTRELALSSDGRYVAFSAYDAGLVPGDTNNVTDVFLRDRAAGTTERVSVGTNGVEAEGRCGSPSVSADGRYVAFTTAAGNLAPGSGGSFGGVFVRDRVAGVTEAVSALPNGDGTAYLAEHPTISGDGRYVTFSSSSQQLAGTLSPIWSRIYLRDRMANTLKRVSDPAGGTADGDSWNPVIVPDGSRVVFQSAAGNLAPGDTNHQSDVLMYNASSGAVSRASVDGSGGQGTLPASSENAVMSADGGLVFFRSNAFNLISGVNNNTTGIYLLRRGSGQLQRLDVPSTGGVANGDVPTELDRNVGGPSISPDGRVVVFCSAASNLVPGDTYGMLDVFLLDRNMSAIERESVSASGQQLFGDSTCSSQAVSADGRYVAFTSEASTVVPGDTNFAADDFVRDRVTRAVTRVNLTPGGQQADGRRFGTPQPPVISADGTTVAFNTPAGNFYPAGQYAVRQIFTRDLVHGVTTPVSIGLNGVFGNGECQGQTISADGRYVAFTTGASNLVAGDTNFAADGFVWDRQSGTLERVTLNAGGTELSRGGFLSSLSADGRYALFGTFSPELTGTPITSSATLWLRDRATNTLEPISASGTGDLWHGAFARSPAAMSADLSLVLFDADTVPLPPGVNYLFHGPARDVFLRVRGTVVVPAPPSNLTALPVNGQVQLTWVDNSGNETGFRVERATSAAGPFTPAGTVDANVSTYVDAGASPATTYYYRVRSFNAAGDSPPAATVSVTTPAAVPAPPTLLSAAAENSRSIVLTWTGSVAGTVVWVERAAGADGFVGIGAVDGGENRYTDGTSPNTTYTYRLHASNEVGDSPNSNSVTVTTPQEPPLVPGPLSAFVVSESQVDVSWLNSPNNNTDEYRLERRTGSGSWAEIAAVSAGTDRYSDRSLAANTVYGYRLRGRNAAGYSPYTEPATITTLPTPTGILIAPKSLSFGNARLGAFLEKPMLVRNKDAAHSLRVTIGAPAAPFRVVSGGGSVLVPPGATAVVQLRFTPTVKGGAKGVLTLNSSQPGHSAVQVKLSGKGVR